MKNRNLTSVLYAFLLLILMTGCEFIGDVFEAGVWVGAFIVLVIVLFALWLLVKLMR